MQDFIYSKTVLLPPTSRAIEKLFDVVVFITFVQSVYSLINAYTLQQQYLVVIYLTVVLITLLKLVAVRNSHPCSLIAFASALGLVTVVMVAVGFKAATFSVNFKLLVAWYTCVITFSLYMSCHYATQPEVRVLVPV